MVVIFCFHRDLNLIPSLCPVQPLTTKPRGVGYFIFLSFHISFLKLKHLHICFAHAFFFLLDQRSCAFLYKSNSSIGTTCDENGS